MQDILKANGITAKEETLRDPSQALCQTMLKSPCCESQPSL